MTRRLHSGLYYTWSKEFLEAGKKRLSGDTARQASSGEAKELRHEMRDLKEALAEQVLENRLLKKSMTGAGGWGRQRMRYPASEKLAIIRLVERSHLSVPRTVDRLGSPATTFYRWYDRYRAFGAVAGGGMPRGVPRYPLLHPE